MRVNRETRADQWFVRLALGACLLAMPALASKPNPCQAQCAGSLSKETQVCMKKCPSPSKRGQRDDYQACGQRCSERFNREYSKCAKSCAPSEPEESHSKKGKHHH